MARVRSAARRRETPLLVRQAAAQPDHRRRGNEPELGFRDRECVEAAKGKTPGSYPREGSFIVAFAFRASSAR